MNNEISKAIVGRFFESLDLLKADRVIRGKQTFTNAYGLNRRNLWVMEKNPEVGKFYPCLLYYLVSDYKVSADWLLTGDGSFYSSGWDADKVRALVAERKKK